MGIDLSAVPPPLPVEECSLESVARRAQDLVPMPQVLQRVMKLARDGKSGTAQMAQVVAEDPALSASLLRMANSTFYRGAHEIADVPAAVARLGLQQVEQTLITLSVAQKPAQANALSEKVRLLMVANAASARVVARYTDEAEPETLFLIALLQDVGQMILAMAEPEDYPFVWDRVTRQREDVMYVEQITYGFTHADLGERLAQDWELPQVVREGILFHHDVVGAMSNGLAKASLNAAVTALAADIGLALYGLRPRAQISAEGLKAHNGQAILGLSDGVLDGLWDECRAASFELGAIFGLS